MVKVRERVAKPEEKGFKKDSFRANDNILFFDDYSQQWKVGVFEEWLGDVANPDDHTARVFDSASGQPLHLELTLPPEKIIFPDLAKLYEINGKNYLIDPASIRVDQDTHEVEMDLVSGDERLSNINLEMVRNLESVQDTGGALKTKIDQLKAEIHTKSDVRAKDVMRKLTDLERQSTEVGEKLGSLDVWQEIGATQGKEIGAQIKQLQKDLNATVDALRVELEAIKPPQAKEDDLREEATGLEERLEAENKVAVQKAKKQYDDDKSAATKEHKQWQDDKKKWETDKKAYDKYLKDRKNWEDKMEAFHVRGEGKDPTKQEPKIVDDPGPAPTEPISPDSLPAVDEDKEKINTAYKLFEEIRDNPPSDNHKKIIEKVEKEADKKAKRQGFADYKAVPDGIREEMVAKIFMEVTAAEKAKNPEAGEVFDLKKEKTELLEKVKELRARAEKLKMTAEVARLDAGKTRIEAVDTLPTDIEKQKAILQYWESLGGIEVAIYQKEREKSTQAVEIAAEQKDIDIPDTVLRELFADRLVQVRAAMEAIYMQDLSFEGETTVTNETVLLAMENLMKTKPNEEMLAKLRQYGIKNWESFQQIWENKMAKRAVKVLHEWGQDDLRSEIAKQTGAMDAFKALKWQLGARVLTNLALVGGGAALATAVFASGGLAGVALAAAGGAAGGGMRALAQKFIFGSKWLEDRKKKQLEEMAANKRQEIINNILNKRFGGKERTEFGSETNAVFSSIMADAIRQASAEAGLVVGKGEDFASAEAKALEGDEKRLYIQALRSAVESGVNLSAEQKIKMAVTLKELLRQGEKRAQAAVENSDPAVIRLIDGVMAGYSGAKASKDNYGWSGAATTMAAGAAVGAAFFSSSALARGVLGGLGGATAGYKFGEARADKKEAAQTQREFERRFRKMDAVCSDFLNDPNYLTIEQLRNFGEEVKKFSRYLKGNYDTVAEQKLVAFLEITPIAKQRVENLVYQTYRRGVFAKIALAELQQHTDEAAKDSEIKLADSTKAAMKKFGQRAFWTTGGAVAGATFAVLAGKGFQEMGKDVMKMAGIGHHEAVPHPVIPKHTIIETKMAGTAGVAAVAGEQVSTATAEAPSTGVTSESGAEAVSARPAGLVEVEGIKAGEKISFENWRHKIMEGMGYKFEHGKIEHALRFHPGAKFELVDSKGDTVGEFEFKKGDSTWRALDHLHSKAGHMLKEGEVPSIKIVGFDNDKVEILDNYKIEGHGAKDLKLDWSGEKRPDVHDLPKGNFDNSTIPRGEAGTFTASDGQQYEQLPGGEHADYYLHDNHLYTFEGKYIGEQYVSGAGKTTWSKGETISADDHKNLEEMLKGTAERGGGTGGQSGGGNVAEGAEKVSAVQVGAKIEETAAEEKVAELTGSAKEFHPSAAEVKDFVDYLEGYKKNWQSLLQDNFLKMNVNSAAKEAISSDINALIDKNQAAFMSGGQANVDKEVFKVFQSGNRTDFDALNEFIKDHAMAETKLFLYGNEGGHSTSVGGVKEMEVDPSGSHAIRITANNGKEMFLYSKDYQFALDSKSKQLIIGAGGKWRVVPEVKFDPKGNPKF